MLNFHKSGRLPLIVSLAMMGCIFTLTPVATIAQTSDSESTQGFLDTMANSGGYDTSNPQTNQVGLSLAAARVVRTAISLIGVIFIVYVIYGGFLWLTAAGNDDQIDKAKLIIRDGIIGIIVILSTLGIYSLTLRIFVNAFHSDAQTQYQSQTYGGWLF